MAILAQSSADFAHSYNFQGTRILGATRGHLCDMWLLVHYSERLQSLVIPTLELSRILYGVTKLPFAVSLY